MNTTQVAALVILTAVIAAVVLYFLRKRIKEKNLAKERMREDVQTGMSSVSGNVMIGREHLQRRQQEQSAPQYQMRRISKGSIGGGPLNPDPKARREGKKPRE